MPRQPLRSAHLGRVQVRAVVLLLPLLVLLLKLLPIRRVLPAICDGFDNRVTRTLGQRLVVSISVYSSHTDA